MPRPTVYTPELGARICERLAQCGSLRRVCADESLPTDDRVRLWVAQNEEFAGAYARAKEAGIDALVDESLDIADDASNDWMEKLDKDGKAIGWQLNGDHVQRSKLRVEYRRWLAERMAPKKYGLKTSQEISGPDGGPVKQQVVVSTGVPSADDSIA